MSRETKKYHSEELIEKKYVLMPAIVNAIKKKKWRKLIDIGCTAQRHYHKFAKKGAKIVGVDKNIEKLNIDLSDEAKKKLGVQYVKSEITKLKTIKSGSFDVALLNTVITEISDEKSVKSIFTQAHRVLRKNGVLIIGEIHPHHAGTKNNLLEKVFNRGLRGKKHPILSNDYHYTLEFLLNSLSQAGFMLEQMKELTYDKTHPTHIVLIEKKV